MKLQTGPLQLPPGNGLDSLEQGFKQLIEGSFTLRPEKPIENFMKTQAVRLGVQVFEKQPNRQQDHIQIRHLEAPISA